MVDSYDIVVLGCSDGTTFIGSQVGKSMGILHKAYELRDFVAVPTRRLAEDMNPNSPTQRNESYADRVIEEYRKGNFCSGRITIESPISRCVVSFPYTPAD